MKPYIEKAWDILGHALVKGTEDVELESKIRLSDLIDEVWKDGYKAGIQGFYMAIEMGREEGRQSVYEEMKTAQKVPNKQHN